MYKIGEFSILSKTTIKALRYYEKEKLLVPAYVDNMTGYRYYETYQLIDLSKIISYKQVGLSIKDIKKVLNDHDTSQILINRKKEIENNLKEFSDELLKINYLLKEDNMNNEVIVKELPEYTVYYKDAKLKDFSDLVPFILGSGEECRELNPNIKCVTPDYCYISYLDGEYKETDFKVRYAQAVEEAGKENENIKFMKLEPVEAVCLYHKGSYQGLRQSYMKVMKFIEDNGYEIKEFPREHYIDVMWNKEDENDWLTEIQVPVVKK